MYGPKWPFLLMYGSHDMGHTGFPRVDGLSMGPPGFGVSQTLRFSIQSIQRIFIVLHKFSQNYSTRDNEATL